MDYYEKTTNGEALSSGNFLNGQWANQGYQGFLGFGTDLNGDCCGTENTETDCVCDDDCAITDCVKWHGNVPSSATIEVPSVGLEPGGTFTMPLNPVTFDEFVGYERCPHWMPHKVTLIEHEGNQIWWQDASTYRDIPWFLRDCYPLPQEKEYLPPPCDEHVLQNPDGTIDVSQQGVEDPIPLQYYGYTERAGCNGITEFFALRITLRFISSTLNSCGVNCINYYENVTCGTLGQFCICTPNASQLMLDITAAFNFTGFQWNCGEPERPEFNQDAVPPAYVCMNNAASVGDSLRYNPTQTQYEITDYTLNPSPCWSNVYSSNPCDYWQKVTINFANNPNQ